MIAEYLIVRGAALTSGHPPPRAMSAIKTEKHNDYKHCPESHIKQHGGIVMINHHGKSCSSLGPAQ